MKLLLRNIGHFLRAGNYSAAAKEIARFYILIIVCIFSSFASKAQVNRLLNKGNESYKKQNYTEAEKAYSDALGRDQDSYNSNFNMGDALYQQKRYKEATGYFERAADLAKNKQQKEQSYYNLGNSYLKQEQIEASIEAYKNALKLNPDDLHAKSNLSYAIEKRRQKEKQQQMLRTQQNQNQTNKDKSQKARPNDGNNNKDQSNAGSPSKKDKNSISDAEAEQIMNSLKNNEHKIRERMYKRQKQEQREKTGKQW